MSIYGFVIKKARAYKHGEQLDIRDAIIWHDKEKIGYATSIDGIISIEYVSDEVKKSFIATADTYTKDYPNGAELIYKIRGEQTKRKEDTAEANLCKDLMFLYLLYEKAKKVWKAGYQYLGIFRKNRYVGDELYYYAVNKNQLEQLRTYYPRTVCLLTEKSFCIERKNNTL